MIKFIKKADPENSHDIADVCITIPCSHCTATEIADVFKEFLLAIGYYPETVKQVFNEYDENEEPETEE